MFVRAKASGKYRVKVPGFEEYRAMASCQDACPLHTDAKGYASAIADGDFERAYWIARQTNPLAAVCGRVCQAPCEQGCRRAERDGPVALRALKRFACDRHGIDPGPVVRERFQELADGGGPVRDLLSTDAAGLLRLARLRREEHGDAGREAARVAVVGSGPAGLAAAHDLALLGYRVTIYEAAGEPGGMLRWGIPEFRLPREVLEAEIRGILDLGVELRLNSPVGKGRSISGLREEGFDAVFLAVGLQGTRWLSVEGSDLEGIYGAIAYLREAERVPASRRCVVIGGGGVAIDCAQVALRRGAESVTVACLESWDEMPAGRLEKEDAREEGIRFQTGVGPKRFVGRDGRVTGVELLEVESLFDPEGNFHPVLRPGTERVLEAEQVILAVGQSTDQASLSTQDGIATTRLGTIRVDEDLATNVPGVFAGGDILGGPQSVVRAISEGKKAARSIDAYLTGRRMRVRRRGVMKVIGVPGRAPEAERIKPSGPPRRPPAERVKDRGEIELPYGEEEARRQAVRCRQCNVQTVFRRSLCILCGICVDSCVENAYKMVRVADIEGGEEVERLVHVLARGVPVGGEMTAIIKDESRCVRCGVCARRCPTGAITMEAFHVEEEWTDA